MQNYIPGYENNSDRKPYENRRYSLPVRRFCPFVTGMLLAANILYFLVLELNGSTNDGLYMARHGTLIAAFVVEKKEYYRLFTSFFMHFGLRHLFNNMLLLWYLGMRLEKYLGHIRFAVLYLVCGLGANVASLLYYMTFNPYANCAGASGAVFGIVGAMLWIVLRHRGRMADLTTRQLVLMIVFTLYNGFTGSGINNVAHIAGLILGFLLGVLFYRGGAGASRVRPGDSFDGWHDVQ